MSELIVEVTLIKSDIHHNGVKTMYKITEPSGKIRLLPPLYFSQMTCQDNQGKRRYDKTVPTNYWDMHELLTKNGYSQCYHYTEWIHESEVWNDRVGGKDIKTIYKELQQ